MPGGSELQIAKGSGVHVEKWPLSKNLFKTIIVLIFLKIFYGRKERGT